jgi:hypothetical protein
MLQEQLSILNPLNLSRILVKFVVLNLMISVLWNIISFIVFFPLSRSLYTLTSDYFFAIYRRFFNLIHITVVF